MWLELILIFCDRRLLCALGVVIVPQGAAAVSSWIIAVLSVEGEFWGVGGYPESQTIVNAWDLFILTGLVDSSIY